MIRSMKDLSKYLFKAKDGDVGRINDFYFDEKTWRVRYLVLDTGRWLPGRRVLISPQAIDTVDWVGREFQLDLSKQKIEDSPLAEEDAPVSRQHEADLHRYYGWDAPWLTAPTAMGVAAAVPPTQEALDEAGSPTITATEAADPHLRSFQEVTGYDIEAADGSLGVISDMACEDDIWVIRYLVVDTRKWLPGKSVLVSPDWVKQIDWAESQVELGMTRQELKDGPEFDPNEPINRQYEERLYDFYGRPRYWQEERKGQA